MRTEAAGLASDPRGRAHRPRQGRRPSRVLKNAPRFSTLPAAPSDQTAGKVEELAERRVFQQPAGAPSSGIRKLGVYNLMLAYPGCVNRLFTPSFPKLTYDSACAG